MSGPEDFFTPKGTRSADDPAIHINKSEEMIPQHIKEAIVQVSDWMEENGKAESHPGRSEEWLEQHRINTCVILNLAGLESLDSLTEVVRSFLATTANILNLMGVPKEHNFEVCKKVGRAYGNAISDVLKSAKHDDSDDSED